MPAVTQTELGNSIVEAGRVKCNRCQANGSMSAEDRHFTEAAYKHAANLVHNAGLGVRVGPFLLHGGSMPSLQVRLKEGDKTMVVGIALDPRTMVQMKNQKAAVVCMLRELAQELEHTQT